jgi:hypothetical protein
VGQEKKGEGGSAQRFVARAGRPAATPTSEHGRQCCFANRGGRAGRG